MAFVPLQDEQLVIKTYWKGIHNAIQNVLEVIWVRKVKFYFLDSYLENGQREANICSVFYCWQAKRPSQKKKKRLSNNSEHVDGHHNGMCRMQRLTAEVNYNKDLFVCNPRRLDVDVANLR